MIRRYRSRPARWPGDAGSLARLVSRAWERLGPNVSMHAGDLWWRAGLGSELQVFEDDAGRAVGLVELVRRDPSCDIVVDPDLREPLERILFTWVRREVDRPGAAALVVGCFEDDRERHALLESLGFARTDHHYVHYLRPLEEIETFEPAAGYTIRPIGGPGEAGARVELGRAAFGSTRLTVERFEALSAGPGYDRELDLLAVAPDGRPAACATCWFDPLTKVGEFEPIGCHPDHRRRGLARALIGEGLRRLRGRGARSAIVYTGGGNAAARALYESCGFRATGIDHDYAMEPTGPSPESEERR